MFILDVRGGGTPHIQLMDIWPDVLNGVGTPHIILREGTPHTEIGSGGTPLISDPASRRVGGPDAFYSPLWL